MTARERFHAIMNFQPFDRLPVVEWATWWDQTIKRWHGEGLDPRVTDRYEICRHFEQDVYVQFWFPSMGRGCPRPSSHGAGILKTMDDYERIREYLYPWPVVDHEWWIRAAEQQSKGDIVIWFTVDGFFWFPRKLFGIEPHIYAFYDEPELMHRMNEDLSTWILRIIDEICSICVPDFMTFAEDMSYNHGPMLSKKLFDEFLRPYYHKVIPALKERGIISIVDSDGDITVASSWFREAGLDGILPLERQAGVDVAEVRKMHPNMRFIGCFDKMVMNQGEIAMREEFERLLPTAAQGGLVVSCDHQTPPGVSYEDYLLYMRLFREYAKKAGEMSSNR